MRGGRWGPDRVEMNFFSSRARRDPQASPSSTARTAAVALVAALAFAGSPTDQESASGPAERAADSGDAVPGELIVRFRDDTSSTERGDARERADVSLERARSDEGGGSALTPPAGTVAPIVG